MTQTLPVFLATVTVKWKQLRLGFMAWERGLERRRPELQGWSAPGQGRSQLGEVAQCGFLASGSEDKSGLSWFVGWLGQCKGEGGWVSFS